LEKVEKNASSKRTYTLDSTDLRDEYDRLVLLGKATSEDKQIYDVLHELHHLRIEMNDRLYKLWSISGCPGIKEMEKANKILKLKPIEVSDFL
jgi:hypothetical protein